MEKAKVATLACLPIVGIVGYFLYKRVFTRTLIITVGEGGTTSPPPGTYHLKLMEKVTITAIPYEGYTYGTWTVDGVDQGHVPQITITMDTDHYVTCTFWKGGQPPPTYPVALKSLGATPAITPIAAWITGTPCINQHVHVGHARPPESAKVTFQAVDSSDKGVPNIDVALWTDPMPDASRYKGILLLDNNIHTVENPLIKKTDSQGKVSAELYYLYGLDDGFQQICQDTGLGFTMVFCPLPAIVTNVVARDCYQLYNFACVSQWGGTELAIGSHRIYAQIVGTTIQTLELVPYGFRTFWGQPA